MALNLRTLPLHASTVHVDRLALRVDCNDLATWRCIVLEFNQDTTHPMNRSLREQIIAISARISALRDEAKAKEAELRKAEAELDALFSTSGEVPPSALQPVTSDDARSLYETVLALVNSTPGAKFSAEEILGKIPGANNINSIRSALARLTSQKRIERAGRGQYRSLAEVVLNTEEEDPGQGQGGPE